MLKKTLLELVQDILEKTDGEEVNSINDSLEALDAAGVVRSVWEDIVSQRNLRENQELLKLTAAADSTKPTHFTYPDGVKNIVRLWYNISTTTTPEYREIKYLDPLDFLSLTDNQTTNFVEVSDSNGGTTLFIRNDYMPDYWTSFDNNNVVLNSYLATEESTLQESKIRAYGVKYPTWSHTDTHTPDLEETLFPFLATESLALYQDLFKSGTTPKVEQKSRRSRTHTQDHTNRNPKKIKRNNFARR